MRATMLDLTVEASFSRPRVSIDNAYAEALFRRAKHCPTWPERPFDTSEEARLAKSARWSREIRNWHWAGTDLSPGVRIELSCYLIRIDMVRGR